MVDPGSAHVQSSCQKIQLSTKESVHHVIVLVRFVSLLIHPRVKTMDLSTMPKALKDVIYRQLELLNLGAGMRFDHQEQVLKYLGLRKL